MKGLWVPIAGGVCIPLFLFTLVSFAGHAIEHRLRMPWLADALMFAIIWPMALWERVFPPLTTGPTDKAIAATMISVFLFYALITYLIQMVVGRIRA